MRPALSGLGPGCKAQKEPRLPRRRHINRHALGLTERQRFPSLGQKRPLLNCARLHIHARNLRVDLATTIFVQRPRKHVQILPVGSVSLKHIRQSINHRLVQVHQRLGEVALRGAQQRKRSIVFGPAELVTHNESIIGRVDYTSEGRPVGKGLERRDTSGRRGVIYLPDWNSNRASLRPYPLSGLTSASIHRWVSAPAPSAAMATAWPKPLRYMCPSFLPVKSSCVMHFSAEQRKGGSSSCQPQILAGRRRPGEPCCRRGRAIALGG